MIKAEIIADSLNSYGNRITTFIVTFPRIVLSEFNTHRALSRNSASSRAIPFKKMLKMVKENPFIPIAWQKDHTGMQGTEYFTEQEDIETLTQEWLNARDFAVQQASLLSENNLTKQLCNRLLEPFMWHTVIVTGTEWENFFSLRANDMAEIHIQKLAYEMLKAYNESVPKKLNPGEWHIPFGDKFTKPFYKTEDFNYGRITWIPLPEADGEWANKWIEEQKVKVAVARCARISYLNFEGNDDYEADIILHDRLLASGHMSPFEHCARAMDIDEYSRGWTRNENSEDSSGGWCGNFRGFIQYRKLLPNENKFDERVKKHTSNE